MSKRSSVESPNHQSSSTPIKPALQAVLGSLDVNLEAELTTYRRHRRRANSGCRPQFVPGKQTATTEQQLAQNLAPETAEETQQPLSLPLSLAGTQGDAPLATTRGGTKLSTSAFAPNNYLESSEKLIESLDESKAEPTVERSLAASLLTPLGLSSMLLFLLSCTALGYAVMYPSNLVKMAGLNRFLDRTSPSSSDSPASTSISDTSTKELPKAPNLVSKEFVELDLSDSSAMLSRQSARFLPRHQKHQSHQLRQRLRPQRGCADSYRRWQPGQRQGTRTQQSEYGFASHSQPQRRPACADTAYTASNTLPSPASSHIPRDSIPSRSIPRDSIPSRSIPSRSISPGKTCTGCRRFLLRCHRLHRRKIAAASQNRSSGCLRAELLKGCQN